MIRRLRDGQFTDMCRPLPMMPSQLSAAATASSIFQSFHVCRPAHQSWRPTTAGGVRMESIAAEVSVHPVSLLSVSPNSVVFKNGLSVRIRVLNCWHFAPASNASDLVARDHRALVYGRGVSPRMAYYVVGSLIIIAPRRFSIARWSCGRLSVRRSLFVR